MPQLGLGTEIGRVSGGAYDSDALAYFSRAGIASGTQTPSSYDNAASFNGSNQFLRISDNASLRLAGTDFTISLWVRPTVLSNNFLLSKWDGVNDYALYQFATGRFTWTTRGVDNLSAGSLSVGTWSLIVITYTGTTLRIYLNGTLDSTFTSVAPPIDTTNNYSINGDSGGNFGTNASISSVGFWKRALTASEVTALFNNGAGRTYASLDSGLRTNLISWWALNQNSVTADSHGTNTLTNNGSVTAPNIGPIVTTTQNSRQLINNFVKGIKSLGLWNSMVCWPLRASQNAGGGTTAFSLGGLGQFNGTLVNAPVWGANGITRTSSADSYIDVTGLSVTATGQFSALAAVSLSAVVNASQLNILALQYNTDTIGATGRLSLYTETAGARNLIVRGSNGVENVTRELVSTSAIITNNEFHFFSGGVGPKPNLERTLARNGTSVGVSYGSMPSAWTAIGNNSAIMRAQGNSAGYHATASLVAFCSEALTNGQQSSIYSLYRQTLGLGLNLP
jgi:hypothetical protein